MMGGHHAISGAAVWIALTAPAVSWTFIGPHLNWAGLAPQLAWAPVTIQLTTGLVAAGPLIVLAGAQLAAGSALRPDWDHPEATEAHSMISPSLTGQTLTSVLTHDDEWSSPC